MRKLPLLFSKIKRKKEKERKKKKNHVLMPVVPILFSPVN